MESFDLLIFDWDGTLVDSTQQIVSTMQAVIRDLHLPPRSDRQIGELIGLGLADGIRRLYPQEGDISIASLVTAYRSRAPAMAYVAPLFEGACHTLGTLRETGYRLAVATGKSRVGLDRSLQIHGVLVSLLETTRCADESADKPDPLMLHQILRRTGVRAERALMIGDTEYDVAMASAIRMPALGVCSGAHGATRLQSAGACAVIDDVSALPQWLAAQ